MAGGKVCQLACWLLLVYILFLGWRVVVVTAQRASCPLGDFKDMFHFEGRWSVTGNLETFVLPKQGRELFFPSSYSFFLPEWIDDWRIQLDVHGLAPPEPKQIQLRRRWRPLVERIVFSGSACRRMGTHVKAGSSAVGEQLRVLFHTPKFHSFSLVCWTVEPPQSNVV